MREKVDFPVPFEPVTRIRAGSDDPELDPEANNKSRVSFHATGISTAVMLFVLERMGLNESSLNWLVGAVGMFQMLLYVGQSFPMSGISE